MAIPAYVAPNEIIASAWGNDVVDTLVDFNVNKLSRSGGTMTGNLVVLSPTAANHAARKDYVDNNFVADAGGVMSGGLTIGNNPSVGPGTLMEPAGRFLSAVAVNSLTNLYARRGNAALSAGGRYAQFMGGDDPGIVERGSIQVAAGGGVAFQATSDERLKEVLGDFTGEDATEALRAMTPVVYWYTFGPEGTENVGMLAQQLAAAWPRAVDFGIVIPGVGEPGDEWEYDEDGNVIKHEFRPWGIDYSRLTTVLIAGWQALDARITAIEDAA